MNKKSLRKTKLSQKILCSILAASVLGITGSAFAEVITATGDEGDYSRVAGISGDYDTAKDSAVITIEKKRHLSRLD